MELGFSTAKLLVQRRCRETRPRGDLEQLLLDSTIVRAYQRAAGAKGGNIDILWVALAAD